MSFRGTRTRNDKIKHKKSQTQIYYNLEFGILKIEN
jgi:hypothetical protein